MNVTIKDVTFQDQGIYYFAWALVGKDGYQEVCIKIKQPKRHEVKEIIKELSASIAAQISKEKHHRTLIFSWVLNSTKKQKK
ncbi:MAG: hypothetical protein ACRC7H_07120 [Plesiomonas shigelloides]